MKKGWAIMRAARILAAGTALVAVSACVSLGQDPPDSLLSLTPAVQAPVGASAATQSDGALAVSDLDAPAKLDAVRVPVQVDAANIAYLKDAVWVDKPARLFRRLLGETIRATSGRMVIDSGDPALTPKAQLRGTLQEFGYDARTSSVIVRFDAIRDANGDGLQAQRFEAIISGVAPEAGPVGDALNRAANQVAGEVAAWIG